MASWIPDEKTPNTYKGSASLPHSQPPSSLPSPAGISTSLAAPKPNKAVHLLPPQRLQGNVCHVCQQHNVMLTTGAGVPTTDSLRFGYQPSSTAGSCSKEEQLHILKSENDQLEREYARVVTQLKKVIKMNTHWQRYDAQREEYVLKLTRTQHELQDKVEDLQKLVDELLNKSDSSPDRSASSRELSTESSGSSSSNRDEEIAALREKISILERGRASRKKADDDELAMLQEQINVCVDDFKQERKDREGIHDDQRLKERLAQNEEEIFVYQEVIKRLQERCQPHPVPRLQKKHCDRPQIMDLLLQIVVQYQNEQMKGDKFYQHHSAVSAIEDRPQHKRMKRPDLPYPPRDFKSDGVQEPGDLPDWHKPMRRGAAKTSAPDIEGATQKQQKLDDYGARLQCSRCQAFYNVYDFLDHVTVCMD